MKIILIHNKVNSSELFIPEKEIYAVTKADILIRNGEYFVRVKDTLLDGVLVMAFKKTSNITELTV